MGVRVQSNAAVVRVGVRVQSNAAAAAAVLRVQSNVIVLLVTQLPLNASNAVVVFILFHQASDSTTFEWSPDGTHFVTATTAPRLREGNG